ncbi:ATP-grasp domain-containing protein [Maribacter sp. CXY002]|uniref:ATP-grasp domain-containing protein n=1 Tax=Maribacter luteocoastalis TaxID=3407671 RepID=UPI003B675708
MKILITDGESDHALNVLHCFKRRKGLIIYVLSKKKISLVRFSRYCHKFIYYPPFESENDYLEFIKSMIQEYKIDVLFPVDEDGIQYISKHSLKFQNLCKIALIPKSELSLKVSDKWTFYKALKGSGVNLPDTFLIDEVKEISCPLILKPRRGKSGEGIYLIRNLKEIEQLKILKSEYIAQKFIEGYDIDCSFIARNGSVLALIVQKPIRKNNALNFEPAKDLEICKNEQIKSLIESVVKDLSWNGVGHADLRYCIETGKFYLIEINPRYWSSILASLAAGINFPMLALDLNPKAQFDLESYNAIHFLGMKSEIKRIILNRRKKTPSDFSSLYHFIYDPMPYFTYKVNWLLQRYFH